MAKSSKQTRPLVGLIMGSQSDWTTMHHAADTLAALGVACETRIVSAHRTPKRLVSYASGAKARGLKVWAETCTQYFVLTAQDQDRPGFEGAKFMCSPFDPA